MKTFHKTVVNNTYFDLDFMEFIVYLCIFFYVDSSETFQSRFKFYLGFCFSLSLKLKFSRNSNFKC